MSVSRFTGLTPKIRAAALAAALGAGAAAAQDVDFNIGTLPAGKTITVRFQALINPATAAGAVSNQGIVTGDGGLSQLTDDPDTGVPDDPTVTPIQQPVDLDVTKTESADPVVAGSGAGNLTYVVTVTNNGPGDASGVTLSEAITLPAGVTLGSVTPSGGTTYAPPNDPNGTWTVGNLANGASATLTVVLTAGPSAAAATDAISDTATVTAVDQDDNNPGNDSATESTSIARQIDLAVTKTESADPVVAGSGPGNLTHVVTVTNNGPSDASGVTLAEDLTLPAGVTVDSVTPSAGSFTTTTAPDGTWTVGDLAAGASATLTVVLTVGPATAAGTDVVADTATVTAANEALIATGDDAATEATSVLREADLAMDKSDDGSVAAAGSSYTYTLEVTNNGPSDSSGSTVTDTLPAGWSFTSSSNGSCAGDGGNPETVTCTVGTIAAGGSASFTITASVPAGAAAGIVNNTASVAGNETDPNAANDSDIEPTTVALEADLSITKDDGVTSVGAGGQVTYTITASNAGPSDVSGATVSDAFAADLTCTWTCAAAGGASCTAGPVAGDINDSVDLPAGGSVTYTAVCDVDPGASGTLSNTATVTPPAGIGDPNPGNESDTDNDTEVLDDFDYGDAPDPTYPTLLASDGARHLQPSALFLGGAVDIDADGQQTAAADGDDTDADGDDEDGVTFTSSLVAGATADVDIAVSTTGGLLNAWVDFSGDGDWGDAGEQIFADQTLAAGVNALSFAVPIDATLGTTYARFRVDSGGGLSFDGLASDGEAEDYEVTIGAEADLAVTIGAAYDPAAAHTVQLWELTVSNGGPSDATGVTLEQELPPGSYFLGAEPAAVPCMLSSGVALSCDLGDLAAGATTTLTVGAFIDGRFEGDQTSEAMVSATETDPAAADNEDDVTVSVARGRSTLATTRSTGTPVVVSVAREADETIGLVAAEAATGGNREYAIAGLGYRTVAMAEVPDFDGTPAPEIAALGFGFDGTTRVFVFDADSLDLLSSLPVPFPGAPTVPIDLAAVPDFGGTPAPELAVLGADPVAGETALTVIDAASGALLSSVTVDFPDSGDFALGLDGVPDFGGTPSPDLAALVRTAGMGNVFVLPLDPVSGPIAPIPGPSGTGLFPFDLAAVDELGVTPAEDVGVLSRRPADGALIVDLIDPAIGLPAGQVLFDGSLDPAGLAVVPNFAGSPAPELAVLARKGTDLVVEVRDAASGAVLGTPADSAPPKVPVPLDLAVHPSFGGIGDPDLSVLFEFDADPTQIDVFDASAAAPFLIYFLP